jgi:hypothetical protein
MPRRIPGQYMPRPNPSTWRHVAVYSMPLPLATCAEPVSRELIMSQSTMSECEVPRYAVPDRIRGDARSFVAVTRVNQRNTADAKSLVSCT